MKLLTLLFFVFTAPLFAQDNPPEDVPRGSVRFMPLYQRWKIGSGGTFSQASAVFSFYQPIGTYAGFSLRSAGGATSGDVTKLNGLADAQLGLSYQWEPAHVVLSVGVNLPISKKKMTTQEFQTSLLLSNSVFNMQVPGFGSGLNINPRAVWALPLSEDLVVGVGASYHYKGSYKPLASAGDYDPGDEILVTGGIDLALASATTLSADAVVTFSGKDKLAGKEIFAAGSKIIGNLQFRKAFGHDALRLFLRYRTRSTSEVAVGTAFVPEIQKLEPDNFDAIGSYSLRVSDLFSVLFLVEGRFYKETPLAISGVKLFGVGLSPSFAVSKNVSIPLTCKLQFGSYKGGNSLQSQELGVGLMVAY
jgi:hypothetical protein